MLWTENDVIRLCFNVIILYTVLRIDSRETREKKKNRMPRLEVITRNWFDWFDEIWKKEVARGN